jgi:hypothetical protein
MFDITAGFVEPAVIGNAPSLPLFFLQVHFSTVTGGCKSAVKAYSEVVLSVAQLIKRAVLFQTPVKMLDCLLSKKKGGWIAGK